MDAPAFTAENLPLTSGNRGNSASGQQANLRQTPSISQAPEMQLSVIASGGTSHPSSIQTASVSQTASFSQTPSGRGRQTPSGRTRAGRGRAPSGRAASGRQAPSGRGRAASGRQTPLGRQLGPSGRQTPLGRQTPVDERQTPQTLMSQTPQTGPTELEGIRASGSNQQGRRISHPSNNDIMEMIMNEVRAGRQEQRKTSDDIKKIGISIRKLCEDYERLKKELKEQADVAFTIESSAYKASYSL